MQSTFSPDRGLQSWMSWMISMASKKKDLRVESWQEGQPLKLLFAGYAGGRNTGGDVRVTEMIRQIHHILGDDKITSSVLTMDTSKTQNYFTLSNQVTLPQVFPPFLYKECPKYHGVIACEGSMFKSKFADALSTMMAGSLGMANAEEKLSVGYGAEAGFMNPGLKSFVEKQCRQSLVLCRNEASEKILSQMSIRTTPGTDTAWTFMPSSQNKSSTLLKESGWDGKKPIVAICPIDPFCWPVRANIKKFIKKTFLGQNKEDHYKSIYFHDMDQQSRLDFDRYITSIANALSRFEDQNDVFPILIGMEKLDRKACMAINAKRQTNLPMFISDDIDIDEMVGILHQASMLISSRFHAIVCSMTGLVPSAGITMDERIHNLLHARGDQDLLMRVDQEDLEEKTYQALCKLSQEATLIKDRIKKMLPREIQKMGEMGMAFANEVTRIYPAFAPKVTSNRWEDYLPALSPSMQKVMEK